MAAASRNLEILSPGCPYWAASAVLSEAPGFCPCGSFGGLGWLRGGGNPSPGCPYWAASAVLSETPGFCPCGPFGGLGWLRGPCSPFGGVFWGRIATRASGVSYPGHRRSPRRMTPWIAASARSGLSVSPLVWGRPFRRTPVPALLALPCTCRDRRSPTVPAACVPLVASSLPSFYDDFLF